MMKLRITLLSSVLIFAMTSFAHNGNEHVMGNVTAISVNSITVQSAGKQAKATTVSILPSTMFLKSGARVSLKGLKVGDRVVVEARKNKDDTLEAASVTFGKPQPRSGTGDMPGMEMPK
jgi:hypothetical protein